MISNLSSESDVLAALRAGDEHALEQLFRDRYDVLTEQAVAELGNPALASVVVERAFLHAWDERTRFDSATALDAYLHDAVHEGAVRESQRRAALHHIAERSGAHHVHHEHHAAAPAPRATVHQAWAHLAAALHAATGAVDASTAERRAQAFRHEAAEHVAMVAKHRTPWVTVGLIFAGAIAVGGMMWALNRTGEEVATTNALASSKARILSAMPGQRALVTLLDGSRVTLGPDSRLVVPEGFPKSPRAVKLEGTASFADVPAMEKPLEVRAGSASLTTTAHAFDVASYPDDSAVTVRVRDGSMTVKTPVGTRQLEAGSSLAIAADGTMREPTSQALNESLGWTDGHFVVANRPLRDVLPQLKRWYALDLRVADSTILSRPVSMDASLGAPRNAITALENGPGNGIKFGWVNDTMYLSDANKPVSGNAKRPVGGKR